MFILTYLDEIIRGPRAQQRDLIIKITGSFGRYQLWLCFLIFLSKFPIAFHQMAIVFLGPPAMWVCGTNVTINQCPCQEPIFNQSAEFTKTIVTEFQLICDRRWLLMFNQTVFQLGTLLGSLIFGMLSDSYGRRKPWLGACVLQVVFGISASYTQTYEWFTFFRFIIGLSVGGTMVIGFVIMMEFIGPEHREILSALYQLPFNFGVFMLPGIAYVFRDYTYFQMAISVPELVFVIYFFFIPETPRWLIAMKQTERAIVILENVAERNKRPTNTVRADVLAYQLAAEQNKLAKGHIVDLFKTPNLRKNNLAVAFNWFTCSGCFYGMSQYLGTLAGNVFLNIMIPAAFTILGTIFSIPLMKWMGRKTILLACHCVSTCCLFLLAFVSSGTVAMIIASFGVVASFIVFVVVYLYTGELFPTVVRNAAVGFSSMVARIGSMIAPMVILLSDIQPWMTPIAFASVTFCAFFITTTLPETKGCELTTTIEEGERFGKKKPQDGKS